MAAASSDTQSPRRGLRRRRWLALGGATAALTLIASFALQRSSGTALMFEDTFDGSRLDRSTWAVCYPYRDQDCTNEFNGELQSYTEDSIEVRDGTARLTAVDERARAYRHDGSLQDMAYRSGLISSHDSFSFIYGYAEFRVKLPGGRGLWPALWLLPQSGEWPPEIDVMELLGDSRDTVYMTLHVENGEPQEMSWSGPDFTRGWHTFAVDWTPEALVWYVDGVERARTSDGVPSVPMHLIANVAVGGEWPGPPDASTEFPATMEIDYVRVWSERPVAED